MVSAFFPPDEECKYSMYWSMGQQGPWGKGQGRQAGTLGEKGMGLMGKETGSLRKEEVKRSGPLVGMKGD